MTIKKTCARMKPSSGGGVIPLPVVKSTSVCTQNRCDSCTDGYSPDVRRDPLVLLGFFYCPKSKEEMKMKLSTRKLTALAMCAAISYVVMVFGRIPIVLFLKFDPKDFILATTSLVFGLVPSLLVALVVCLVEMFTVSSTGLLGFFMNIIASAAFVIPLSVLVKDRRDAKRTLFALFISIITMTVIMLAWNIVITPIYMKVPVEKVLELLFSAILPFNLFKGLVNSALTFITLPLVPRLQRIVGIENEDVKTISVFQVAWISALLLVSALVIYYAVN